MSVSAASSRCAAIFLPLAMILSTALTIAVPPTAERAAAVGAHAERHAAGVAVDDLDVLDRDAELGRDHLREGRLVALAVAVRAGEDGDGAGRVHPHLAGLEQTGARAERAGDVRRRESAGFDVARVAEAAQPALRGRFGLARREAGDVGALEHLVEVRRVVAGVVGQPDRRRIRKFGDEVLAPDRRRIHLHVARRLFDDALDHVGGFRPAGAAVGIDRRGVGEHRLDLDVDRRRLVLAGQQGAVEDRRHARREGRQVRAHVGDGLDAQRQELALGVQRELDLGDMVAAVGVGQERFAALGGPLDRPADLLAGPDQRGLLRVEEDLRAEAAADIGRDHAHLRLRQAEHERAHQQPLDVRVLVGDVERVAVVVLGVDRVGGARLDRVRDQPVVDELELADVRRGRERRVDRFLAAVAPVVADVVRARRRAPRPAHRRPARCRSPPAALRSRPRSARPRPWPAACVSATTSATWSPTWRTLPCASTGCGGSFIGVPSLLWISQPHGRPPTLASARSAPVKIRTTPGACCGLRGVDRADARMRMRRAQEHAVGLAVHHDVVGVAAGAGQEARVFAAPQRLADRADGRN